MSAFLTKLQFEDDGGFPFTLLEPLVYKSDVLGFTVTVPEGFKTDLASIPQLLENVIPRIGAYDAAAVIHDDLYQHPPEGLARGTADSVLREAMDVCHVSRVKRWAIYAGVRVGGWVTWNRYRAEDAQRAVHV